MVVESPITQEQTIPAPSEPQKPVIHEDQSAGPEPGPLPVNGETAVNGVESGHEHQSSQPSSVIPNGMPATYAFGPPGAMYGVGPPPEMYQGGPNVNGPRMMQPIPYPYPPSQSGQQNPAMPPNGYAFPPMIPHPPSANGGVSPSSPTSATPMQMAPYASPYGMWYPAPPGMAMQGPPGVMPATGMPPMIPMGHFPPHGAMYPPPPQQQNVGDGQNSGEAASQQQQQQPQPQQQQQPHPLQNGEQANGAGWTPGPGGLPPKEVAQTILCRYYPDCRFGSSCWFMHPGAESNKQPQPNGNQQEGQPSGAYLSGPLPPPVQYRSSGPWDPSAAPVNNGTDANKGPYSTPVPGPHPAGYGLMYAPYPFVNGYPPMYPQSHPPQQPTATAVNPQSPSQPPRQMSPHGDQQNAQQQAASPHPHSSAVPSPTIGSPPGMFPVNGAPGAWYPASPGSFPPNMQQHMPPTLQTISSPQVPPGMISSPISPVSPSGQPNGQPIQAMGIPSQPISPSTFNGPPQPIQQPVTLPISPPYTQSTLHPRSPPQQMHPLSPPNHAGSPLYSNNPPLPPAVPVVTPHGHHSRRESMSSMAAVPMGSVLGPHLDGNGQMDGSRSPPSAFREMGDNSFGPGRRGRGGHSSRGSWGAGNFNGTGRKPPCAFFPAGKCKNGDQCRFPHIMPDENAPVSPISPRGGYPGSLGRPGSRRPTILGPIEDKMAELTVKENEGAENGDAASRPAGFHKQYSPKLRGTRQSFSTSTPPTPVNRQNPHLQTQQIPSQRVPSADDFPVLGGTATPPSGGQSYAGAWGGPTAAQVLKGSIGAKKPTTPGAGGTNDMNKDYRPSPDKEQYSDDASHGVEKVIEGVTMNA